MNPVYLPLAGAAIGIFGVALGAILNAFLSGRNERAKWSRDKRSEAYAEFVAALARLSSAADKYYRAGGEPPERSDLGPFLIPEEIVPEHEKAYIAYNRVQLIGGSAVRESSQKLSNHHSGMTLGKNRFPETYRPTAELIKVFMVEARRELG